MKRAQQLLVLVAAVYTLLLILPVPATAQGTTPYLRTVVVSPVPGNPVASGTNLLNQLAAITGAGSGDRWLLKIEPGVYDVGTTPLQMKPWVDIEGSGRIQTVIQGTGQSEQGFDFSVGVVQGASAAEMRNLTVSCVSTVERPACLTVVNNGASTSFLQMNVTATSDVGSGSHWGFRNGNGSPSFDQVTVTVANGTFNYGIVNTSGATPTIRRSFIKVVQAVNDNTAILNRYGGLPRVLEDTTIQARIGDTCHGINDTGEAPAPAPLVLVRVTMLVDNGTSGNYGVLGGLNDLMVDHSEITVWGSNGVAISKASGHAVRVIDSEVTASQVIAEAASVSIGSSWLRGGGAITGFTTERCAGVYNNNFTFYPNTCP